jgi:hypothetical protein
VALPRPASQPRPSLWTHLWAPSSPGARPSLLPPLLPPSFPPFLPFSLPPSSCTRKQPDPGSGSGLTREIPNLVGGRGWRPAEGGGKGGAGPLGCTEGELGVEMVSTGSPWPWVSQKDSH